ncbi:MAG: ATP-binding protein, partial [Firmicutes bacterium]|nr:ATP-binding protein [Bacillota bacterium]
MYARILTASLHGLDAETTWVEVDAENGMPSFSVVGLANQSIKEAKDRIHAAMVNCGYLFPPKRFTVNLTPANRRKEGSHYDLAIALGLLLSTGQLSLQEGEPLACLGELSLDGRITPVDGVLSMIITLQSKGIENIMLPKENLPEACLVKGAKLYPVETLPQAADHISGFDPIRPVLADGLPVAEQGSAIPDFSDIRGQNAVKRAAQLAAAGRHGML